MNYLLRTLAAFLIGFVVLFIGSLMQTELGAYAFIVRYAIVMIPIAFVCGKFKKATAYPAIPGILSTGPLSRAASGVGRNVAISAMGQSAVRQFLVWTTFLQVASAFVATRLY